jgi:glucosamine 6-phosphate synthetase-like amidotransferase/phosphosugar isomerase protein
VLNGIVENYRELKASLESEGHTFRTETTRRSWST